MILFRYLWPVVEVIHNVFEFVGTVNVILSVSCRKRKSMPTPAHLCRSQSAIRQALTTIADLNSQDSGTGGKIF